MIIPKKDIDSKYQSFLQQYQHLIHNHNLNHSTKEKQEQRQKDEQIQYQLRRTALVTATTHITTTTSTTIQEILNWTFWTDSCWIESGCGQLALQNGYPKEARVWTQFNK